MTRLGQEFYSGETRVIAKKLLGCKLVRLIGGERCEGIIVETEAYLHQDDPACHAAKGRTRRNEMMFGQAGHLYVYCIHSRYCMNVVTEEVGLGAAVLIRAIEPVCGEVLLAKNRNQIARKTPLRREDWTNGPGKLCEAFGIDAAQNGVNLNSDEKLWLEKAVEVPPKWIRESGRIGISQGTELMYRYFVDGNRFVSGSASSHRRKRVDSILDRDG